MLEAVNLVQPVAGEVTGPRKEYITDVLLNGHITELPLKCLCL